MARNFIFLPTSASMLFQLISGRGTAQPCACLGMRSRQKSPLHHLLPGNVRSQNVPEENRIISRANHSRPIRNRKGKKKIREENASKLP